MKETENKVLLKSYVTYAKGNGGEYGKWTRDIWSIECENCGAEVDFDECEVD